MVFLAVFFLGTDWVKAPAAPWNGGGGLYYFWRCVMSDFMLDLLDFCLIPFVRTDNLMILIPTACLTVYFLFLIIRLLMGGYH